MHTSVQQALSLPKQKQKSKEWFKKRSECKLTASEFASALGRGSQSRNLLFQIKTGEKKKTEPFGKFVDHGTKWEPYVREEFMKRNNMQVYEFGCVTHAEMNPDGCTYLGGSPDGITEDGTLIEIKCPYTKEPEPIVPKKYMDQIQGLMWIFDLPKAIYIEFKPADPDYGQEEKWEQVEVLRDLEWEIINIPLLVKFCDQVDVKKYGLKTRK